MHISLLRYREDKDSGDYRDKDSNNNNQRQTQNKNVNSRKRGNKITKINISKTISIIKAR